MQDTPTGSVTGEEYVAASDHLLNYPLVCSACGSEVESARLLFLRAGEPLCPDCRSVADEVALTKHKGGYPNNGIGIIQDESMSWREVVDREEVSVR